MLKFFINELVTSRKDVPEIARTLAESGYGGFATVIAADGELEITLRHFIVNLFLLYPLIDTKLPILKGDFCVEPVIGSKVIAAQQTRHYRRILDEKGSTNEVKELAIEGMYKSIEDLYNFNFVHTAEYVESLDIVGITNLLEIPEVKKHTDIGLSSDMNTDIVEQRLHEHTNPLIKVLGDSKHKHTNQLYPFQKLKVLNPNQVSQFLVGLGPRTDIDNGIIKRPIIKSIVDGLNDIEDYATESLSAKLTQVLNRTVISDSQYFGRKQHLALSAIRHIYPGDCGTNVFVGFAVSAGNHTSVVGKFYMDGGTLCEVTEENSKSLIGKTIDLRSPIGCRYTDGVCEICMGRMKDYISNRLSLGILCATNMVAPVTQRILSAKHQVKTISIVYKPSVDVSSLFHCRFDNTMTWINPTDHMWISIPRKNVRHITDVLIINDFDKVNEHHFGEIEMFEIFNEKNPEKCLPVHLHDGHQSPYFSREFLKHIHQNWDLVEVTDEQVKIPLSGFDQKQPMMKTTVLNDSIADFVKSVRTFLDTTIKNYHSCRMALQDFADLIHSKEDINLLHLEVIIKAYMMTSDRDPRIPVVEDPDNVLFGDNGMVVMRRSIAEELAYEKLPEYLGSARTYVDPKQHGIFDDMLGL